MIIFSDKEFDRVDIDCIDVTTTGGLLTMVVFVDVFVDFAMM